MEVESFLEETLSENMMEQLVPSSEGLDYDCLDYDHLA